MAGLGLIGSVAAGAAGGFFDQTLKNIEEKRKEGFTRLQAKLNQETNTLSNSQQAEANMLLQKQRGEDTRANTTLSNEGLMARQNANNQAQAALQSQKDKAAMERDRFNANNKESKATRNYTYEKKLDMLAEAQKQWVELGDKSIPKPTMQDIEMSLVDPGTIARSVFEQWKNARDKQEADAIENSGYEALPESASRMLAALIEAEEERQTQTLRSSLNKSVTNNKHSSFSLPYKKESNASKQMQAGFSGLMM